MSRPDHTPAPGDAGAPEHADAARVATLAGERLLELRRALDDGETDLKALRRRADAGAQELIAAELAAAYPEDAVLSEEAADDPARLAAQRVWIVDPLDGTREFAEAGRTDWAVHIAFWEAGELRAGAVALPALGVTLSTADPPLVPPPDSRPPRLLVSRTRPPAHASVLAEALGGELVPMGSAGAKAMAVVRGDADVYAHAGGQYEWDSAAPVAVAAAAGLHVSRLDGSPLRYNAANPYLPDLLVCRPDLAEAVLTAVG